MEKEDIVMEKCGDGRSVEKRCEVRKERVEGRCGEGMSVEERCGRRNECGGEVWEKE